jgi:hypothetical protein
MKLQPRLCISLRWYAFRQMARHERLGHPLAEMMSAAESWCCVAKYRGDQAV